MSPSTIASVIGDLEQQLRTATMQNDCVLHERLLADTWLDINANGTVTTKAQLLALLKSQPFHFIAIDDDDILIRDYTNTAVVTGRSTRQRRGSDGQTIIQLVRFTRVYALIANQWQVVSSQATVVNE